MKNMLLIILFVFFVKLQSFGQESNNCTKGNIWVDSYSVVIGSDSNAVALRNKGIVDGTVVSYSKSIENGKIYVDNLGYYADNIPKGSEIFFSSNGVISILRINITPNTNFIGAQKTYFKEYVFPYQSYRYDFYENGKIRGEGWEIIGEDIDIDSEKVGVWKFYDENGNCELVDFSKDDIDLKKYDRY